MVSGTSSAAVNCDARGQSIATYQLPITSYQLPITSYHLPITNYQLPITNHQNMRHAIAITSLVAGTVSTGLSLGGYFSDRYSWCVRQNPCIRTESWNQPNPEIKTQLIPGTGTTRTIAGVVGAIGFGVAVVVTGAAAKQEERRLIAEAAAKKEAETLEANQAAVLLEEEKQKLAIASELRVDAFRKEQLNAHAKLFLLQNPEAIERFAAQEAPLPPPEPEQQPEPLLNQNQQPLSNNQSPEPEQQVQPEQPEVVLAKLIGEHEGGWFGQLVVKPLLIYGDMGSFKSYLAATIALVRHFAHGHAIASITDPHFHQNKTEAWKYLVQLDPKPVTYGAKHNYTEVARGMQAMYKRFSERTQEDPWLTSIFDEVTNYALYKECKETAALLLQKVLSDPRKAHEAPILIAHSNNMGAIGGSEGFSKMRDRGLIQIELFSDSENKPLFKGRITGIKDAEGKVIEREITLAQWMRPEHVWGLFNSVAQQKPKLTREMLNDFLSDCWELENPPKQLTKLQHKLLKYLAGKQPKTPRQIKKNSSDFSDYSEAEIRDALVQLVQIESVLQQGDAYYLPDLSD